MKIIILTGVLIAAVSTLVLIKSGYADRVVHVQQMDSDADFSSMQQPGVRIRSLASLNRDHSDLLPPQERNAVLARCGFTDQMQHMDEVDRDVLMIRAKNDPLLTLQKKYPELNAASLEKLHKELTAQGARHE
jgi:hypothetical protein